MVVSLYISLLIILISYLLLRNYKMDSKYKFLIVMGINLLCLAILVYPLFDIEDITLRITNSIYFALKSITLNEEITILNNISLTNFFGWFYFLWVNVFLISLPVFTVSTLISFISDLFTDLKLRKIKNKHLYIFSEMNDKSLTIAKYYANNQDSAIIFLNALNKEENEDYSFKAIKLSETINEINLNNYQNNITLYMISDDEEQNLNNTLEIIDKYKTKSMMIYVINNTKEAPTILDSTDKGLLKVEVVNETERAIFSLLDNSPLYINTVNNQISLLIVGCGVVGKEFLKDATWCGTLIGYKFKALVIDLKADEIKENLEIENPDFLKNYDITFLNCDIKSKKAMDAIRKTKDINYVLVSMETDGKNLDTAIELRKLFIRENERKPIINIWIQSEFKRYQINKLVNEKNDLYEINAFGSINDMYFENRIVDSDIEKLAIKIHLAYDKDINNYYLNDYNKRSSRASAIHVKYKLYSILKEKYTNNLNEDLKLFREMYNKKIEDSLAKNEHDRWNAYMRTIGYTCSTIKEVKEYYPLIHDHRDFLGRRHPALVPFEKLDSVSKKLQNMGINKDLRKSDYDIVKMMLNKF